MENNLQIKNMIKKIKTLMIMRLIIVTAVMVAGSLALRVEKIPFYYIIAIFYFVTFIYALLLRTRFSLFLNAYIQIIVDIILETIVIYYAGGADSVYAFLYIPSIVASGVIIGSIAAKTIAGLSSLFYCIISIIQFFNIIPDTQALYSERIYEVIFIVSFRAMIFCLVGYLSSYLSRELYKERIALAKLRNLNELILKNITSGVLTLDNNSRIIYANPSVKEILGVEEKDILNTYWPSLFWKELDNDKINKFINQAKSQGGVEREIIGRSGRRLTLCFTYADLFDESNMVMGGVFTFIDMTQLKDLEQEICQREKLSAMGEMAVGIANEIKEPLTSIKSIVELFKKNKQAGIDNEKLIEIISGESDKLNRILENFLKYTEERKHSGKINFENIIGESLSMKRVYELMIKVAQTDSTVLIYGESGTGKELVAKAIHNNSPRKNRSFVAINCGGLPEGILESELFGHVRGSFTGAVSDKVGLFQIADGGTIFLDEISATSPIIQVKLLRVLQEREIKRVGDTKNIPVDVRVITATNKLLDEEVKKGIFREDLYYRLTVIPIHLPPLRERKEDIPLLAQHFLTKHSGAGRANLKTLGHGVLDIFTQYNWPGNVRELENVIERAITLCEGIVILLKDLPPNFQNDLGTKQETTKTKLKDVMRQKEKEYIDSILEQVKGDKKEAAKLLGVDLATLYRKLQE